MKTTINKQIKVPPHKFGAHKEYIKNEISKIEKLNYSNELGYVEKINKINNITYLNSIKNDFCGSVLFNVDFEITYFNPEIGDTLSCTIVKAGHIILAIGPAIKVIIPTDENTKNVKEGDKVKIVVLAKEIINQMDFIKIVGKFVELEQ